MSRRAARCTQADIARALRAMAQEGVCGAVEVTPEGVLRIVPASRVPSKDPLEKKPPRVF